MTDNRKASSIVLLNMRVTRLQPNPEGERSYCVMQRMEDENGNYAGWKHISKGYRHSTSAFAALGRLVQKQLLPLNATE